MEKPNSKSGVIPLPLVSYLVLTMNRSRELSRCIESIREQEYPHLEIVVVDNASSDGTGEMVRKNFPEVRYRRLRENLGAAQGRNQAFSMARGEICVVLDDDAELAGREATRRIVEYFREDPGLGALSLNVKNAFTGKVDTKAVPRRDKRILMQDYPCTYFCAAGVAIRRSAFEEAGGFWGELFIYAEELDLAYRILDRGYRMLHSSGIDVLHRESPVARPSGRYFRYSTRNRIWIAWRNLPWPNALTTSLAWAAHNGVKSLRSGLFPAYLAGVGDALRGMKHPLRQRKVLDPATMKVLKQYSGRVWY